MMAVVKIIKLYWFLKFMTVRCPKIYKWGYNYGYFDARRLKSMNILLDKRWILGE